GTQKTCHYIKGYQHASVTDMAIIIDSDTTDVHGNLARLQWLENFFLASQGVVYMLRHDRFCCFIIYCNGYSLSSFFAHIARRPMLRLHLLLVCTTNVQQR